jgi:NDP-sugar pyrophosphorylase family protein
MKDGKDGKDGNDGRDDVCAVVLAAGEGRRLRPLTSSTPKALCPVGNVALLDRAIGRVAALGFDAPHRLAVNACYLGEQVVAHVGERAHLSVEPGEPLGTAGGLGNLKPWIDGRGVLAANADAYLADGDVRQLLDGWDGSTVRLLGVPGPPNEFGTYRFAGMSLLPWDLVEQLEAMPADLVRTTWRPAERAGRLEVIPFVGTYLDTGTPKDYLAANLHAAGEGSLIDPTATVRGRVQRAVIGAGARIDGSLTRSVVWAGGAVEAGEHLVDAIRVGRDLTVSVTATMSP